MANKYERPGPWDDEPDSLDWVDEKTGYRCHILRVRDSGHLCGYVEMPEGHPLHGVEYGDNIPESMKPLQNSVMEGEVGKRGPMDVFCMALGGDFHAGYLFNVHGGVTFSGSAYWADRTGFWYGFDCAHCDDLSPGRDYGWHSGVYRDLEYVKAECASLAKQLKQVAG